MECNLAFVIYENLRSLITYRNIDTPHTWYDETAFTKEMNTVELVKIKGTRDDVHGKRDIIILLLAPNAEASSSSPAFKKMFKNFITTTQLTAGIEILVISSIAPSSHIRQQIFTYRREFPNIFIEYDTYPKFSIVVPEHILVPKHKIMTTDEYDAAFKLYKINKEDFPKIVSDDPMVLWLGARPGDVLEIERESEAMGVASGYRIVVTARQQK